MFGAGKRELAIGLALAAVAILFGGWFVRLLGFGVAVAAGWLAHILVGTAGQCAFCAASADVMPTCTACRTRQRTPPAPPAPPPPPES
jgi:hypothetical protein